MATTPERQGIRRYLEKMKELNVNDQDISDEEMLSIPRRRGHRRDADGVKPEHALACQLRGGGDEEAAASGVLQKVPVARLVVLPRCRTSVSRGSRTYWCPMVSAFLDDVPPTTPDLF